MPPNPTMSAWFTGEPKDGWWDREWGVAETVAWGSRQGGRTRQDVDRTRCTNDPSCDHALTKAEKCRIRVHMCRKKCATYTGPIPSPAESQAHMCNCAGSPGSFSLAPLNNIP